MTDEIEERALRANGVCVDRLGGMPVVAQSAGDLADAYRGAMIGTAIGDALGRPAEGRDPERLRKRFGRLSLDPPMK